MIRIPLRAVCPRSCPRRLACLSVLASVLAHPVLVNAQTGSCSPAVAESYLDIGNVRARILNNGNLFWRGDPYVYEVPKGGGTSSVFNAGFWVGGMQDEELRVAASRYSQYEFWAGPLDDLGNPPDDCSTFDRIWKINRSDIEAYENGLGATTDLAEWPTGLGAPTLEPAADNVVDDDGDGEVDEEGEMRRVTFFYTPFSQRANRVIDLEAGERPDIRGDQMLWWIMNDRGNVHESTDSTPVGIEVHASAFAFLQPGDVGSATFYDYTVFNRSGPILEDAYFGVFVDPELGTFDDDYVGSDTTLGIGFVYNADNDDEGGYGVSPPATSVAFLETPVVPALGDTALVDGVPRPDFRNAGLTTFLAYQSFSDTGSLAGTMPESAAEYYRNMRGLWRDGTPIRVGGDGLSEGDTVATTRFMFSGDPVTGAFWSEINTDGDGTPGNPTDQRFLLSSGPFAILPGTPQRLSFMIAWASGADHLDSVTKLREANETVRSEYARQVDSGCFALPRTDQMDYANVSAKLISNGNLFASDFESGYEVPRGSEIHAIRSAGLWIAGEADGTIKGSTAERSAAGSQLFPGPLDEHGRPVDGCSAHARIWLVSVDDIAEYETTDDATEDLRTWPTGLGAPTFDADGMLIDVMDEPLASRRYRTIDLHAGERPAMQGHEMAWWIANDVGTRGLDEPLGIEVHNLAFSVAASPLASTTFYRHRVFLRRPDSIVNAYVGINGESNVGHREGDLSADDDYVGVDSAAGLAYMYNADEEDETGYGYFPAALGLQFLRGPAVPDPGHTAHVGEAELPDHRNLSMTSFLSYGEDDGPTGLPTDLDHVYNYLRGAWKDGQPVTRGGNGRNELGTPTMLMFSGDPPGYWSELDSDGLGTPNDPAGGRRFVAASGPFTMEHGDEQEFSYALVWASSTSSLHALEEMRSAAASAVASFKAGSFPPPDFVRQPPIAAFPDIIYVGLAASRDTSVTVRFENGGGGYLHWAVDDDLDKVITNFLTTHNADGPLDPPDYGAYAYNFNGFPSPTTLNRPIAGVQQANSNATWGIHAYPALTDFGSLSESETFLGRLLRNDNVVRMGHDDYEIRFTGESSYAATFGSDALVPLPFELWRTGRGTPLDASDDVRLIAYLCESACVPTSRQDGVFDIGDDHVVSVGDNDPFSDPIHWFEPVDLAPGEAGYEMFVEDTARVGGEVFAGMVLVSAEGGYTPPYAAPYPEQGTVLRLVTSKRLIRNASPGSASLGPMGGVDVRIDLLAPGRSGVYSDTVYVSTNDAGSPAQQVAVVAHVAGFDQTVVVDPDASMEYHFVNVQDTVASIYFADVGSVTEVSLLQHSGSNPPGLEPALTRFFDIATVGDEFDATLEIHYKETDLTDGGVTSDEEDLRLISWNGERWIEGGGVADEGRNVVSRSGLTEFGRFAIADPDVVFVGTDESELVDELALDPVYPNPSSEVVNIVFRNPDQNRVRVDVFDILGRRVSVLRDEETSPGEHVIPYVVSSLSNGVYFVRLTGDRQQRVRTLVVAR